MFHFYQVLLRFRFTLLEFRRLRIRNLGLCPHSFAQFVSSLNSPRRPFTSLNKPPRRSAIKSSPPARLPHPPKSFASATKITHPTITHLFRISLHPFRYENSLSLSSESSCIAFTHVGWSPNARGTPNIRIARFACDSYRICIAHREQPLQRTLSRI